MSVCVCVVFSVKLVMSTLSLLVMCLYVQYGDTILIHAVKGNHLDIVRALLKKYADVDVQGVVSLLLLH